jgi:hypothetical protein
MVGLPQPLQRQPGNGLLDQPGALVALQQFLHLLLAVPVLPLDVALEDLVIVAQTHLPKAVHVVLQQLLLLGVGQHQQPLHRPLQQRRLRPAHRLPDSPARVLPEPLVVPVELHVSLLAGKRLLLVLPQLGNHALPQDCRLRSARQFRQTATLQVFEALHSGV